MPNASIQGNNIFPRSGAFEVTIEGKLVYSKLQTGSFPNMENIANWF